MLKDLSWSFYLSFEVKPDEPKQLEFSDINIENSPSKMRRIVFDWHNFLSGCTAWDYEQWEKWIEIDIKTEIALTTMRNFNLMAGRYSLEVIYAGKGSKCKPGVLQKSENIASGDEKTVFETDGGKLVLQLTPEEGRCLVAGIIISAIPDAKSSY